jgi:hypothetical protein
VSGHHSVHTGLQKHSVGDIYPLAVVGYGTGDEVEYCVEHLTNGTIAAFQRGKSFKRRSWYRASDAYAFAVLVRDGEFVDGEDELVWVPFRQAESQVLNFEPDTELSAEERAAIMQVSVPEQSPPDGRWNWYGAAEPAVQPEPTYSLSREQALMVHRLLHCHVTGQDEGPRGAFNELSRELARLFKFDRREVRDFGEDRVYLK